MLTKYFQLMSSLNYKIDLKEYSGARFPEIDYFDGDFDLLQEEIDNFNSEIEWDAMWDVPTAKERLAKGWHFLVLKLEGKIRGWHWLEPEAKHTHNLYINKNYRGKNWGYKMNMSTIKIGEDIGLDVILCTPDDWNTPSIIGKEKVGYKLVSQ